MPAAAFGLGRSFGRRRKRVRCEKMGDGVRAGCCAPLSGEAAAAAVSPASSCSSARSWSLPAGVTAVGSWAHRCARPRLDLLGLLAAAVSARSGGLHAGDFGTEAARGPPQAAPAAAVADSDRLGVKSSACRASAATVEDERDSSSRFSGARMLATAAAPWAAESGTARAAVPEAGVSRLQEKKGVVSRQGRQRGRNKGNTGKATSVSPYVQPRAKRGVLSAVMPG